MRRPRPATALAALVVAAVLLGGACGDAASEDADPSGDLTFGADWPRFTAAQLGIGFRMPDDPETITQRVQLPDGSPSEIVVHTLAGEGWELYVSTFPVDPGTYDLDVAAPGAAAAVNGELESVRPITVEGSAGRDAEIRFEVGGEERLLLYRALLLEGGLVQLQTLGPITNRAELEAHHRALVDGVSLG